jgi:acetolactate synthase II small subunit
MSRYRLDLVLRPAEGALLRALGVATRRGYRTVAIAGATSADDGRFALSVTVDATRAPEQLVRQLEKLYDCLSVEIASCT